MATMAGWKGAALVMMAAPAAIAQVSLDMRWDPGAERCDAGAGRTQVHAIDERTIAIRQNPCIHHEANLLYLLIGDERALLIDSGASDDPRHTAELTALVSRYLEASGSRLPLVVAHTHGHEDHRAGDAAFAALPATTVVPIDGEGMRRFFGLQNWPEGNARFDVGGRIIEIVPTPGHHEDHVVFVDPRTRIAFTGDHVLPGRLLVDDIDAYAASTLLLTEAVNTHGITHALGAHVEMDARDELYSRGSTFHPDEHPAALPFTAREASDLRSALTAFNGFYARHDDYVIVNPLHNLIALAAGAAAMLVLLVVLVRRLRRRLRQRRAVAPG